MPMSKISLRQAAACTNAQDIAAVAFAPHFSAANRRQCQMQF